MQDKNAFSNAGRFFDIKFIRSDGNLYTYEVTFPRESTSPLELVQGGMIDSALDEATSWTVHKAFENKKLPFTTDHHVLFHRPIKIGKATIKSEIIKKGSKVTTVEGKLYDQDNKLVATMLHTALPTDPIKLK